MAKRVALIISEETNDNKLWAHEMHFIKNPTGHPSMVQTDEEFKEKAGHDDYHLSMPQIFPYIHFKIFPLLESVLPFYIEANPHETFIISNSIWEIKNAYFVPNEYYHSTRFE